MLHGKSERRKLAQIHAVTRRNDRADREAQRQWDAYVKRNSERIAADAERDAELATTPRTLSQQ